MKTVQITRPVTLRRLTEVLGQDLHKVVQRLMERGFLASPETVVDDDPAQAIASDFGVRLQIIDDEDSGGFTSRLPERPAPGAAPTSARYPEPGNQAK